MCCAVVELGCWPGFDCSPESALRCSRSTRWWIMFYFLLSIPLLYPSVRHRISLVSFKKRAKKNILLSDLFSAN